MTDHVRRIAVLLGALLPLGAGAATPSVYHPYVTVGERELEYAVTWRDLGHGAVSLQRLSLGYAWTDRFATELYVLSEFPAHDSARARAYELELRWQLTEQGEYGSDWGLMVEAERGADGGRHEVAAGVLWEKEVGRRWIAAANALLEYEFGDRIDNEFEASLRGQLRYLRHPAFEPALELHLDDLDHAAGPVLLGMARVGTARKLRWDAGLLFGIDRDTPARTLRIGLEFEF